jgi:hypothetical protein
LEEDNYGCSCREQPFHQHNNNNNNNTAARAVHIQIIIVIITTKANQRKNNIIVTSPLFVIPPSLVIPLSLSSQSYGLLLLFTLPGFRLSWSLLLVQETNIASEIGTSVATKTSTFRGISTTGISSSTNGTAATTGRAKSQLLLPLARISSVSRTKTKTLERLGSMGSTFVSSLARIQHSQGLSGRTTIHQVSESFTV